MVDVARGSPPILTVLAGAIIGWLFGATWWGIAVGSLLALGLTTYVSRRRAERRDAVIALTRAPEGSVAPDPRLLSDESDLGRVYQAVAESRERTASRASDVQEHVREQALLLDRMNEGLMRVSADGVVTYANVAASTLFGGRNPINRSFINVTRDHELDGVVRSCLRTGLERRHTFEIAGEGRVIDSAVVLLRDTPPEALVMLRDVTDMHRLLKLRRDFVANVSHELRTPLSTMKILTETLLELRADDEEAVRFLSKIDDEVDSMTALVRDLLDLTRLESGAGRLATRRVDIATMVDDVCDRMRPLAEKRGVGVVAMVDESAREATIDERRMHQALINLIANAITHSSKGQQVLVRARGDHAFVTFEVEDRGSGIPIADLPRVWERFFKADRARTGPGTGLGLAIVKHIAQAHEGSVSAASAVGEGSTFRILIPRGLTRSAHELDARAESDGIFVPG